MASSDRAIVILHSLFREAIAAVQRGEDPPGVIRDSEAASWVELRPLEEPLALT
jgi:hypothetical protein